MRSTNEESLKDVLKQWINSSSLKPKLTQAKVIQYWEELMGPTITGYTREIYIRDGKLYIFLDSAPLRQELMYGKEKILNIMNEKLGENLLTEVIVR